MISWHDDDDIDLTKYSFEQWIDFVFNHPVSEEDWYYEDQWRHYGTPAHLLPYTSHVFFESLIFYWKSTLPNNWKPASGT